ncbi:MAG: acetate--CoA ligase family protein [Anaerolineales bacterium]|nr:acetate--CoA ligase family protein [Anaerolineales bacterium]
MASPPHTLIPFFSPKGVAIIGASRDPVKLGYGLARNLVESNYQGAIYFVNPKGGEMFNRPVYAYVQEVPNPLDLAVILIPAPAVPDALLQCARRGLRAAILCSGGFRETGPKGAALEEECLSIAQRYGMRLIGPNCIGLLDTHLPLDTTFLPPPGPPPGDVAFISHSGAICAAVIDWARGQGFGLSRLISLGNQVDVCETDVLAPTVADPFTRVLTLYLESVSNGRRFVEEANHTSFQKPIIALKVGRFSSGQRAAASHTGALAGQENAYHAAFRRAGVIRAETSEEMFDWARALAWCPPPKGRAMAVLTNAGGPGVTAADALEANGLQLATFTPETHKKLAKLLPPVASLQNPVDMLASATVEQYAECLRVLIEDPNVNGVMVILPPPPMDSAGAVARALIPVIHTAQKPVIIALMGDRMIQEAVEHFRASHIPEYRFPERAASALAILAERAEFLVRDQSPPPLFEDINHQAVQSLLERFAGDSSSLGNVLPQDLAMQILDAYHIPTLPIRLAKNAEEAIKFAHELTYPVVLKIDSPDIPHKSDVGGVMLNLTDAGAVKQGFDLILHNAKQAQPQAYINGVQVQHMLPPGQETIIGAVQDAQFGALAMFGSGGLEVEGLRDVAFALAPMTQEEAIHLLDSTWAGKRLEGFRNLPPADRQAVETILLRLGQLAGDFPQLAEMEINPLRVLEEGQGAYAVDVRMRYDQKG